MINWLRNLFSRKVIKVDGQKIALNRDCTYIFMILKGAITDKDIDKLRAECFIHGLRASIILTNSLNDDNRLQILEINQ